MKLMRAIWYLVLALVLGFAVQAQQRYNNLTVLTNLQVGQTLNGYDINGLLTNNASSKLNITNGTAVALSGSLTNVTVNGGRPTTDTRATAALFFGDSVVEGYSATTAANTWWRIVADHYGLTYTNLAFSGAVATDLNWQSQPGYTHTNSLNSILYTTPTATATNLTVFAKVGINDGADFPTTSSDHAAYLTHYYQSWLAFAANWATPGKTLATAATESGTWTDWTNYFGSVSGNKSSTSGDTLTFTTMGDAIYIAFPVSLTNTTSFGQFWVSIDGTAVELVNPNGVGYGNRNQWTTPVSYIPFSATNAFWAKRYAGYGQRRHTVLITATNNTTYPTVISWAAGSQQPIGPSSGPSVFLLENLNRAADATRDATYSALRTKVNLVASYLGGDGLQVTIIRPNSVYDSANSGDGIHPNDAGMVQVAQAVRQAVDRFRGLALSAGASSSGSSSVTAGSGLTDSSGTFSLGGTLTADAAISGGTYGLSVSRTSAGNPAIKATVGASTYGVQIDADSSFPLVVTSSGTPVSYWRKTLGSISSPSAVTSGTVIWDQRFMGYDGSAYDNAAKLLTTAEENWSGSAHGANIGIYTTPTGTTTPVLSTLFNASGNVTMAYDLTVDDVNATTLAAAGTSSTQATLTRYNTGTGGANLYLRHARGTSGSPSALSSGDSIGTVNFTPYGSAFSNSAQIEAYAAETLSGSALGTGLRFYTTPTGTTTPTLSLVLNPSTSASFAAGVSATSLTASGLTSGRIPLVSTGGLLIDNSAFTYTSNTHLNVPTLFASTAIELGHASDTTLARSAAGKLTVEGNLVPSPTSPTTGQIIVYTNSAWAAMTPGASGIGGSTGSTDNSLLRADGTGGATAQNSAVIIDDFTSSTANNVAIKVDDGSTANIAAVITPKGTGAFIVGPKPDGTATGGNARGGRAVDLQVDRLLATDVASGNSSVVLGGYRNSATLDYTVAGGALATASGIYGSIALGYVVTSSGGYGSFATGTSTTASGRTSMAGGESAVANKRGQFAVASGQFGAAGDSQTFLITARNNTSSTTQTTLFINGSSEYLTIPNNTTWTFTALLTGTTASGAETYSYKFDGVIVNAAGTTSMPVAVTKTVIYESNAAADADAVANNTNDSLDFKVTAANSTATRWSVSVTANQVSY